VHNGLADLLHLSDKLLGHIPDGILALGQAVSADFPIIFDTGVLVHEEAPSRLEQQGLVSLEDMHKRIVGRHLGTTRLRLKEFGMYTYRASSKRNGLVFGRGMGAAARDTMCIAEAFLLEMHYRICQDRLRRPKAGWKRSLAEAGGEHDHTEDMQQRKFARTCDMVMATPPRKEINMYGVGEVRGLPTPCKLQAENTHGVVSTAEADTDDKLSPSFFNNNALCCLFHNRVAAPGVPCLNLRQSSMLDAAKGREFDLHGFLRRLGAKEDSNGRPVVTRAMAKQVRRMLGRMKSQ